MRRMILPLAALLALACQPTAVPLSEEDVAAIRALGPALDQAALAKDLDALVAMFTDDAVFMPPNAPIVQGRAKFEPWIQSALNAMAITEHVIQLNEVEGAGNFAVARGVYTEAYVLEGATEPTRDTGKILFLLRRQADGSWQFSAEIWNSDIPLPSMEGEHAEGPEHT